MSHSATPQKGSRPVSREPTSPTRPNSNGTKDRLMPSYPISPIHHALLTGLNCSPILSALHVEVRNESYWYHQRKLLKPKKHKAIIISQNKNSMQWEAYIYMMKHREEDLELVPQKSFVAAHKTKLSAFQHAEKACNERDSNPYEKMSVGSVDTEKIKSTHFRIMIVSPYFTNRMSMYDRYTMIYHALINEIGANILPGCSGLGRCPPTRIKMGSIFGENMCNLEPFRFIYTDQPLTLIIETRTPSQWRPDLYHLQSTERFGKSHLSLSSNNIDIPTRPKQQKDRLKKLVKKTAHTSSSSSIISLTSTNSNTISLSESLGLDSSISGIKYKRSGGVYGHFFNDLPPLVKDLILENHKRNKVLIQQEGCKKQEKENKKKKEIDSFQPRTTMSMLRKKVNDAINLAEYDKGTSTEEEMMEEVLIHAKLIEQNVIRCQRIWRIQQLREPPKEIWKRKYAVLQIQRVLRGNFGRAYANILKRLMPIAALRIQRMFLNYKSRIIIAKWHKLTYRLTRWVLPKIKRFIRNCFLSLSIRYDYAAIPIQSLVRMWICKNRYIKIIYERFAYTCVIYDQAATQIQRIIRGRWGRKRHASMFEGVLKNRIDFYACNKIQRIWRGTRGKIILKELKREMKAILLIQKHVVIFVRKIWDSEVAYHLKLKLAAIQIQRIYRGRLDREVFERRKYHHWYYNIYIPSIIRVQSIARKMVAIKIVAFKRARNNAAFRLQRSWKLYLKRLAAWERWKATQLIWINKVVARIQKIIRGYLCKIKFKRMLLSYNGKVTLAAKMIYRAWVNFKYAKRLQILLDDNRYKHLSEKLLMIQNIRKEVLIDIEDIEKDIDLALAALKRVQDRFNEVDKFIIESDMRIAALEKDMNRLTVEDFEKGWADAYGVEFQQLSQQSIMAKEEMRLLRNVTMKRKSEINKLYWELEETEYELMSQSMQEVNCFEQLRFAEVMKIERKVNDKKNRAIRLERCKWKIETVRSNVIKRNRASYKAIVNSAKKSRDMEYAKTLSYEKRAVQRDKEELLTNILLAATSKVGFDIQPYEIYAQPLQKSYDAVLNNTRGLLRGWTLDERARRIHEANVVTEMAQKYRSGGQFSVLKEEFAKKMGIPS